MHIGSKTTSSPFSKIKYLFPLRVGQTLAWYLFSAWWFSEVYKWSCPASAQMEWVKRGRSYERAILNERPIYLHGYHLLLALAQTQCHFFYDYDRIVILVADRIAAAATDQRPREQVSRRIQMFLPQLARDGLATCVILPVAYPVFYTLVLRHSAWKFTMYFAKLFWNFPRSAADPPGMVPPIGLGLFVRTVFSGGLLVLCWQMVNLFFSAFIGREPLKRGQPLTADAKDPNGSLLDGLKAQREVVKTYAFWELCLISQTSPDRRRAIFQDIDREGGPAWSQIVECATGVIQGVCDRINGKPSPGAGPSEQAQHPHQAQPDLKSLPRLVDPPKEDNIFASSPRGSSRHEKFSEAFGTTAKSYGQSPDWTPVARARARDVFDRASSAVLSPERKQRLLGDQTMPTGGPANKTPNEPGGLQLPTRLAVHPVIAQVLRSVGQPLQQTFAQRSASIVLGTPHEAMCPIVYATEALTHLAVASLAEDQYGKVHVDVPAIVRLFTGTIMSIKAFIRGLDIHWTDVTFPPASEPESQAKARLQVDPGVKAVLTSLGVSLGDLLSAFGPYFKDIGLTSEDVRLARESIAAEQ
jgi:nucleoporin NDC1